ncbi:MAG: hypothetical protein AB8F65_07905 [Woeseiaceae bacterium]
MRHPFLILPIALFFSLLVTASYAEDGVEKTRMANEMSKDLQKKLGPQLEAHLTKSGLAALDAKRIVGELVQSVTSCVIDAAESKIEAGGEAPETVFGEMESVDDLDPYFQEEADFNALANGCLLNSMANAGLTPAQ